MSAEENIIQVRKDKHQEVNGGAYPLSEVDVIWDISDVLRTINSMVFENEIMTTLSLEETGGWDNTLRGRITAFRKSGALSFLKLTDMTGSIQLVATKNNLADYDKLRLLDLGDIVEVVGKPCLTKTGERSLLLSSWNILTKSHRSPPEKFMGIIDPELKCRKRYLDLMSSEESRARFMVRTYVIRAIRDFMDNKSKGFLEVETSTLNAISSGANAKPFMTHHNALDIDLRLRIAPELYLKKLLVGGLERVYEIGRNYRNEGIDTKHNPEFTMMEAYQAYENFPSLITFTKSLLSHINKYCELGLPENVKPFFQQWRNEGSFSFSQFMEVTMAQAVIVACVKAGIESPSNSLEIKIKELDNPRLQKIDMKGLFHNLSLCQNMGEKTATLFGYVAEPFLTDDYRTTDGKHSCPVFITEYPKEICPLARANDKNPNICDRFELFVNGHELANAFQELNDPDEQARRFQEQLGINEKDPMDYDADYIEALEHGMPPAVGFGIGIDRLVMLLTNAPSIKDVILFPTLKPLK